MTELRILVRLVDGEPSKGCRQRIGQGDQASIIKGVFIACRQGAGFRRSCANGFAIWRRGLPFFISTSTEENAMQNDIAEQLP
jgi:hypothetical protein